MKHLIRFCLRVDRHNYRYNSDMVEVNRTTTIRVYPMPSCVMESDDLSRRFFNFFVFRMGVTGDDRMYHDALSLSRAFHHHRSDIPDNATPVVIIKILINTSSDEEDPMVVDGEGESDFDEIDHNDDWPLVRILQASMTSTRGLNGSMARAIQESMDEYVALKLVPASQSSIDALGKMTFYRSCTICLEKFCDEGSITRMPCSHVYHGDCITRWLKTNHSCPLCRFKMPTT
ncbi:E3 ubiquitin ligase BIG BROTHER-related-like [Cornus florida]|uniref:E3 ubiquitin ligase BIG BROTHER-related-like n=1 Tax=Cornus florida TaxID=4283 RepID=UPI0028A02FB2|nr:E3 ubiquitin ligase BIG BROTHER-related-like [Cornus florida]